MATSQAILAASTLLNCGLRELSMSPNTLSAVKSAILESPRRRALSEAADTTTSERASVAAYKAIFKAVLDKRPSGMRLRLADALGTNRSFISQISNPIYATPIPAQHLSTIFQLCHFSATEQAAFLAAYEEAHPQRADTMKGGRKERTITLQAPASAAPRKMASSTRCYMSSSDALLR